MVFTLELTDSETADILVKNIPVERTRGLNYQLELIKLVILT